MYQNEILKTIKQYLDMNKLTFFVGAGVSKLSGFPSWYELVKSMGDELDYNYKKSYDATGKEGVDISQSEFLKIPEMYRVKFGKVNYLEKVRSSFQNDCKPNEIHDLIMSLHPNHILTTNYDTLIEDCATKFGENYSVIASDRHISDAETVRYLLKVHGDFSTDFVLKESDYLNYEFNYQLVSNLMKSIFATNLVVFIGYSLDDYNIRLILNWMQNIQKDKFVKPVFINTDDKKTDIEKSYYEERGLCVLDSNDFSESGADYIDKYRNSLNAIINYSPMPKIENKEAVLELLYAKVEGIQNLSHIKRSDFHKMFSNDFKINDEWKIEHLSHISKIDDLWRDYFEHKVEYIAIDEDKCNVIDMFVEAGDIKGVHTERGIYLPKVEITNISFHNNYIDMETYCSVDFSDVRGLFEKAYYLSKIGRLAESYSLYTDVLKASKQSKDWDIYFLSQVNRYHLYRKIDFARTYYMQPFSIFSFGRIMIIDEELFRQMTLEMKHCNIETQFNELPYIFKCNYRFLNNFSECNCFSNEINDLMKHKYDIEKSLEANTTSMGLSKFDKIKLDMLEAVKFAEDNMIFVQEYEESKNYIKNALLIWLRAYDKEINKKSEGIHARICNTRLNFDLQDIILISKSCKKEDLQYYEKNINFKNIPFEKVDKLQSYVTDLMNFYKKKFSGDILMTEYLWWRSLSSEIHSLLYISSYYLKDKEVATEIIEFILGCTDGYWSYQDRMQTVKKYVTEDNSSDVITILEKYLINEISDYKEKNINKDDRIINISKTIAAIARIWTYPLENISKYILDMYKDNLNLIKFSIIKLAPYLILEARELVVQSYEITTVWELIEKVEADNTINIENYLHLIDEYFQKEIEQNNAVGKAIYTEPPQEQFVREVSFFIINNEIKMDTLPNYKGHWSEYDFFFSNDEFDVNMFDTDWLLYYSDKVLEYIQSDERKFNIVKTKLKDMDKSKCKKHIERWLYLFGIFI